MKNITAKGCLSLREIAKASLLVMLMLFIGISAWWNVHRADPTGIYTLYLFTVPILAAAFFYKRTGGLLTALIASIVAVTQLLFIYPGEPHIVQQLIFLILLFNLIVLVTSELAERERRQRAAAQRQTRQIHHLYEASQSLLSGLELTTESLRLTVRHAVELIDARYGALVLYDDEGHISHFVTNLPPEEEGRVDRLPEGRGVLGLLGESGRALRLDDVQGHPAFEGFPAGHPIMTTFLGVSLVGRRGLLGRFYLCNKTKGPFTLDDEQILLTFAANVTTAVENSALYRAMERRAQELSALIEIDQDISATLDLPRVLERIARHAQKIISARDSDIYLLEPLFAPEAKIMRAVVSLSEYSEEIKAQPIKLGEGIVGAVAQAGVAEMINHAELDPRSVQIPGTPADPESLLCAPLVIRDQVIGVMVLSRPGEHEFVQADLSFLVSLAQQASIAIHNAWLYEQARRRAEELEALRQTALDIAAQLEMSRLLATIVRRTSELLGVHGGGIYLMDEDGQSLRLAAVHNLPDHYLGTRLRLGEGAAGRVAQTGRPLVVDDYRTWPGRANVYDLGAAGAVLEVPVQWNRRLIGVLTCHTAAGEPRSFGPEDVHLLERFAQQVAVAMENARLFDVVQQRTHELAEALAHQQELDRLQAEFIQNVSHELRTPLALIRGYAEMLDSGALGQLGEEQQEPVAIIARRARMLSDLVEDITTILELDARAIEPSPVDVGQITREALADFQTWAAQKNIALTSEIAPEVFDATVMGEPRQIRRVIDNLVGNALKFTPEEGAVHVTLVCQVDGLRLTVQDNGIGIPADKLDRIFERFYQVDGSIRRRYGGTGLGLSLVKEIVEAHDGTVSVQSQVGQGSTFSVWFPVCTEHVRERF